MDINQGIKDFQSERDAILIDVRMPEEYSRGHIPGSINVPLNQLREMETKITDKNVPVFVYCQTGGRSSRAKKLLDVSGCTDVRDLGGISGYSGPLER